MTTSEKRTKIRRKRILEFVEHQYRRLEEARYAFLQSESKSEGKSENLWNEYVLLLNESTMFKYGVAMADPYGQWMRKFNDVYDKVQNEFWKDKEKPEW